MTRPTRFLFRMALFLAIVAIASGALFGELVFAFQQNFGLNGMIVAVLVLGIAYVIRQVLALRPEVAWIENFRGTEPGDTGHTAPVLLAPMATMLSERQGRLTLSTLSTRSILDSISARLDEGRDISRYLIGLLIFLGLLGTFWGQLVRGRSVLPLGRPASAHRSRMGAGRDGRPRGSHSQQASMGRSRTRSDAGQFQCRRRRVHRRGRVARR